MNILEDKKNIEKSSKVLGTKRYSLVHNHGKGNQPQAAQALEDDEMFSLRLENWATPIQFLFRELFGGFCPYILIAERGMKVESYTGETYNSHKIKMAKKCLFGWLNVAVKTQRGQEKGHQHAFQPSETKKCVKDSKTKAVSNCTLVSEMSCLSRVKLHSRKNICSVLQKQNHEHTEIGNEHVSSGFVLQASQQIYENS